MKTPPLPRELTDEVVHLGVVLLGQGFVLLPLRLQRRREDGTCVVRIVWRRRDAAGVVTVKTTRRLRLDTAGL